jgi:hypothetical protein
MRPIESADGSTAQAVAAKIQVHYHAENPRRVSHMEASRAALDPNPRPWKAEFAMSFLRHGQIYRPMGYYFRAGDGAVFFSVPAPHRLDEFATGYSLAGCTPALPASASPAGFIFDQPAETVNTNCPKGRIFGRLFNRTAENP